ncbi:MAG: RNA-binding cell elongation regulator Jag/EloR [Limnochordales bacterium]
MRVVEQVGRTVDEAVEAALRQLGVTRQDVEIEVLDEGSKGLFGLLGARKARVRVQLKAGVTPAGSPAAERGEETEPPAGQAAKVEPEEADAELYDDEPPALAKGPLSAEDKATVDRKIAAAERFLTGVLERMGIEAALETRLDEDNLVFINIAGGDLGLIIGRRGQTLDALQFLVNQVANKSGGVWVRFVLDAQGYRERRARALAAMARRMAEKARRERRKVALEPMNALERRVVHLALADMPGIETYSEGEEPERRVIIAPRNV